MRIPFTKPYRAFEEFDGVSAEECERHLRRVAQDMGWLRWAVLAGFVIGAAGAGTALGLLYESALRLRRDIQASESAQTFAILTTVAIVVFAGSLIALLVRDYAMYRGIRREIYRARCPKCKQSLLGVPVKAPHSAGLPIPGDAWVRCPECGKRHNLMAIGLTPRDLIPFEFREARADIGRKRGEWFGREHLPD